MRKKFFASALRFSVGVLLLILLLLQCFSAEAQVMPRVNILVRGKKALVTVSLDETYSLEAVLIDKNGKVVDSFRAEDLEGVYSFTLSYIFPGRYLARISVYAGNKTWFLEKQILFNVNSTDISSMLYNVSKMLAIIQKAPRIYEDLSPKLAKLKNYFKMAVSSYLQGDINGSTSYYEAALKLYTDLYREIESREKSVFIQYPLERLEEYLTLNPRLVVDFWMKVFTSAVLLPLIAILIAPIYVASVEDWINAVSRSRDATDEALHTAIEETRRRALDILLGAVPLVDVNSRTYIMTAVSALIAALGLITNNTVVIIASMLIAPFMSVVIGASIGLSMPHREVTVNNEVIRGEDIFSKGLRNTLMLSLTGILIVIIAVKATSNFLPIIPGKEIMIRSRPNFSDLAIAIGAGLAGAISYVGILEFSGLIGAAIAIALIPPIATMGIGVGIGRLDIALGAFTLLYINIVSIFLTVILIIKAYTIIPVLKYFFKNIVGKAENEIEIVAETIELWFTATFGFREGWDKKTIIFNIGRLLNLFLKYIAFPFITVAIYAIVISSYIPDIIAQALSRALEPLQFLVKISQIGSYSALAIVFLLVLHYSRLSLKDKSKIAKIKFLGSICVLSILVVLLTRIDIFPRSNLIFLTLLTIYTLVVLFWQRIRRNWSHYTILGFTVLSILIISLQSIEIYQASFVAQRLTSHMDLAIDAVALYFGVNVTDVKAEIVQNKKPVLAIYVYISARDLSSIRFYSEKIQILRDALSRLGLNSRNAEIYIVLKP